MPSLTPLPGPGLRIRPFRAVRYTPVAAGDLSRVICPPYDGLRPAHALALRRRPHHLARLLYSARPDEAARQLALWLERGVLVRDEHPALYVYRQHCGDEVLQRGVIGELELAGGGVPVLPHEGVRDHVVSQRAAHLAGLRAQLEPLLLGYRAPGSPATALLDRITARRPLATARDGDVTHTLWACTDPVEQALVAAHPARGSALIADGHHRYAACLRLAARQPRGPWGRTLALLVDQEAHPLRLAAVHRVVPGVDAEKAARAAAEVARVRPLPEGPRLPGPGEIVLTGAGGAWSVTEPRPAPLARALAGRPAAWHDLPAAIADHLLLERAWSVPDLPGAVHHVHDAGLAITSVAAPDRGVAVLLPAVTEPTVRALAEAGVLLPRKSTSFGPKPVAGLVLRLPEPRRAGRAGRTAG
ncbi:DUF1015 domain-containing protein [Streptomyces yaizuensis]|uniref:DUF1015 domain-containing protein n=1 Tax=Streptomyces yaizuensis TaxID=2989713 RepID=A0ABQ5NZT5_9ACTN|nr:DUF1015 domain-containing protein [Streptomyces sp. YSPA8]GLF95866.1 DUF1015 domain-containing protein [Streptomyces sp. YSPA8]